MEVLIDRGSRQNELMKLSLIFYLLESSFLHLFLLNQVSSRNLL